MKFDMPPAWRWPAFATLLLAAFVLRGIMLACVLPPFEMWDEYQHLAYIAVLHDTGHIPILDQTRIPRDFMQAVIQWPLPATAIEEFPNASPVDYQKYWQSPDQHRALGEPQAAIYEAQHPPIYYWLMGSIYAAAGGWHDMPKTVAILRLINVAIAAAGLAVFLIWLGRVCKKPAHAMIIAFWVTLHPLFLLNATRVANDALAVTLGIIVVVWSMSLKPRHLLWHTAGIAAILGIGVLTKATDICLIPFSVCCLVLLAVRRQIRWTQFFAAAAIGTAILLAETAPYFHFTLSHYGLLIPMQEAVINHQKGRTIQDYLHFIHEHPLPYWQDISNRIFVNWGMWVGGWSFKQTPNAYITLFTWSMIISAIGWPLAWLLRRERWNRRDDFPNADIKPLSALLCLLFLAGMTYHALQSSLTWGYPTTLPWYAAIAFPFFWLLMAGSAIAWRHSRLGYAVALGMPLLFIVDELNSTWVTMVKTYSQRPLSITALRRLATLHPSILGPTTLLLSTAAALSVIAVAAVLCVRALRHNFFSPPP
jgi:hypothetical protein